MKINTGIYQITFCGSDKKYIGSAIDLRKRHNYHLCLLKNNKHPNLHLQNAFNKYGECAYQFNILLYCDSENLILYEQTVIDSLIPERLYNICLQANSSLGLKWIWSSKEKAGKHWIGRKHTPETRTKISVANTGTHRSLETRIIMGLWQVGKKQSEETKYKMRMANLGKKASKETKLNMSISQKKRWEKIRLETNLLLREMI